MKCRLLLLLSLSVVLIQGLTSAQTPGEEDQYGKEIRDRQTLLDRSLETKIFDLKYYTAEDMGRILTKVALGPKIVLAVDEASQRIIVTGPSSELKEIAKLIAELDVPKKSTVQSQPIMCRVYMLELPSKDQGWKSFRISLSGSTPVPSSQILNRIESTQLRIEDYSQENVRNGEMWRFNIRGQAASCEAIESLSKVMPDCELNQLRWEGETPIMPTTQVAPLPVDLQKHIERLLGKNAGFVGYWFGNLSIPGSVKAPIGPWSFEFDVERLGADDFLRLNLRVEEERGENTREIMHNTMQAKIGHPVIIGYNRDNNGVSTMGALVLIPESMPNLP